MAKLHDYYVLCPLIDQKSFLGVYPDKDGCLIVTLGRNVVNRYCLSDQKQVGGWTSKDHITSKVVYDKEQNSYVGVFNNNTIKMWKEEGDNLDKLKKFKFPVNILKIIPRGDQPSVIVFSNGNCAALPYAIDNRKTYESKSVIKDSEKIIDSVCYTRNGTDFIAYVIKNAKDAYEIINCPIRHELGDLEKSKLSRVRISRSDKDHIHVVGELICTEDNEMSVYVLWSDAKMTAYDLVKMNWRTVGTVPWISALSHVSMAWMTSKHMILFGSNMDQDGAVILAYNVVLGVGSCKYPMKMYTADAKLSCFNERIILEASNHIGVLPYVLEIRRNLATLLGSHEIQQEDNTEIVKWDMSANQKSTLQMTSIDGPDELKDFVKQGITERSICAQIIPPLLETHDCTKIKTTLEQFNDIPESVLVLLIKHVLKSIDASKADVMDKKAFKEYCTNRENDLSFLNDLLNMTYSDAMLTYYLRDGLSLDDALFLLTYIRYLIFDEDTLIICSFESKLIDWCTMLMDSFYQQFLMTKTEKVTYVLQESLHGVKTLTKHLHIIDNMMIQLYKCLKTKEDVDVPNESVPPYSIEIMQI